MAATNVSAGYTPTGIHLDQSLPEHEQAKINAYKQQWDTANAAGDQAAKDAAHAGAQAIRAQYNYSGGADGSEYHGWGTGAPGHLQQQQQPQYAPAQLQSATPGYEYIDTWNNAAIDAATQALKSAYDQNVLTHEAEAAKIPGLYQDARNQTAATSEQQRMGFNEYAAASGLNSGAGGQAQLSMSNQLQSGLNNLDRGEADATAAMNLERARLETAYKNDIAQAIADGNMQRAQALYQEYIRVDNSIVETSRAQADENYRAHTADYGAWTDNRDFNMGIAGTTGNYGGLTGFLTGQQSQDLNAAWAQAESERLAKLLGTGAAGGGSSGGSSGGTSTTPPTPTPTPSAPPAPTDPLGGTAGAPINTASVLALGYGPISYERLEQLVESGEINAAIGADGQLYFTKAPAPILPGLGIRG